MYETGEFDLNSVNAGFIKILAIITMKRSSLPDLICKYTKPNYNLSIENKNELKKIASCESHEDECRNVFIHSEKSILHRASGILRNNIS